MVNVNSLTKRKNVSKMLSPRSQCLVTGCGGWSFLIVSQIQAAMDGRRRRLNEPSYFPMLNNWYLELKQTGLFNCLKIFSLVFLNQTLNGSNPLHYVHQIKANIARSWAYLVTRWLNGTVKMFMRICLNHQVSDKNGYHVSYLFLGRGVHGQPIVA